MHLAAGFRIGPYEIIAPLGSGGMGDVYRARDTRLARDVAVKSLPEVFAMDQERVSRFRREAQMLAALDHPNIAGIYGVEDASGAGPGSALHLILELIPGVTLAQMLRSSRVALSDALSIARQITDALEAAHDRGIIHRDLKPGNIMVTPDGTVKVLDFGLARADGTNAETATSDSPTFTLAATQAGVLLGTAAYMAPEHSPDGSWVAYVSDQTGGDEVWVRPFPGPGAPSRVTFSGGNEPQWARDGKALFYQVGGKLMSAAVTQTTPLRFAQPRVVVDGGFAAHRGTSRTYDVGRDGSVVLVEEARNLSPTILNVAVGWGEILRDRQ